MPATRFIDNGDPREIQDIMAYWHGVTGHLESQTVVLSLPHVDGAEIIKAIKMMEDLLARK